MSKSAATLISILVVDDQPIVRAGLRTLIEDHSDMILAGEAATRSEALATAGTRRPHIILLELALAHESGLDFLGDLLTVAPESRVVILTGVRDPEAHRRAVHLGAMGLVLKDQAPDVVIKAIEKVHTGEVWLDRTLTASVLSERSREERHQQGDLARIATLTERERQIVELVCQGLRNKQIAEKLFISAATVRNHLTSVLSKLELSNRVELALYAYRQHLAKPPG